MAESETKIYDRAEAIARLDNDEALFGEMVGMFIAECDTYCHALERALAEGDAALLRREAHTLKSVLATFSFESGRALAQQLEALAAGGQLDAAVAVLTGQVVAAARQLAAAFAAEQ